MNSSSRPSAWCSTKARASSAVARELDLVGVGAGPVGQAGAGGSHEGPHRPDDGRARGAGAAPQGAADRRRRARHPKKSNGVFREAEPMRFAFIAAKKAEHTRHHPLPLYARDPQWVLRVGPTRAVGARAARSGLAHETARVPCRQWRALRAARACGRTCRRTARPSAKSACGA